MSAVLGRAIGLNVAEALRQVRPKHTAKTVAQDIGAEIVTVKRWLAGNTPGAGHLGALFSKYGPGFAARVLAPCGDWASLLSVGALEAELHTIQRLAEQLLATTKAIREVAVDENISQASVQGMGPGVSAVRVAGAGGVMAVQMGVPTVHGDGKMAPQEGRR